MECSYCFSLESQDETADKTARQLCLIGLNIGGRPSITLQSGSYWAHSTQAPSSHSNISSVCLHRNASYYCPEAAASEWMGCYGGSEILRGQNLLPELSNYTSSSVSQWSLLIIFLCCFTLYGCGFFHPVSLAWRSLTAAMELLFQASTEETLSLGTFPNCPAFSCQEKVDASRLLFLR